MSREEIQQAIQDLNDSIARLNSKLHPPPLDPGERAELRSELTAAEQAKESLQQMLNNLPRAVAAG